MKSGLVFITAVFAAIGTTCVSAQNFLPVAVTGFNQDVIAEGGPNPLATTSFALDGVLTSNMIIYTEAFRNFAGFSGGGIPDNGIISDAAATYQLGSYTGNNALLLQRTESGDLTLASPAPYAKLRVLCFAAEGASTVNASVYFTDGSSTNYINNYSLADWFNSNTNVVISGYGRCKRLASPPYGQEGYPINPRMYYIEIILSCTDQLKNVERIHISNVSPGVAGAIYPNAVFFALSGAAYSQTITPVITACDCAGPNGSIALNVTGSSAPFSYSWNTSPVQNGATAINLAPGNYSCTITDAGGCNTTYDGIVSLNNNAAISASANPPAVCTGVPVQLNANVTAGTLTAYDWTPGNLPGQTISVSPAATTVYTVNAGNALGCSASAQVTVTVNALPVNPVVNNVTICAGGNAALQVQNPVAGTTYSWYTAATGGSPVATGIAYNVNNVAANIIYYVEASTGSGCVSSSRTPASVTVNANAPLPAADDITICPGEDALLQVQNPQAGFTYNWYDAATGGNLLASGTSYTISYITAATTVYVDAINTNNCPGASRSPVSVSLYQQLPAPVVTVSGVNISSVTFSWTAIPGATGYEVTTDGGISYQPPSSGTTGTTHTISGLNANQTVSLQVRALGDQLCKTSQLSAAVYGTTLSSKEVFVPNAFSPNADGTNDILYVYGTYIATMQFNIFNQWGEKIFASRNTAIGWDGSYKGRQQPVGVYVYTLNVVLQDGSVITKKGSINLIR